VLPDSSGDISLAAANAFSFFEGNPFFYLGAGALEPCFFSFSWCLSGL
jgi:hypothetical protein